MKFRSIIAVFAALVATSFAMDQPSFRTKDVPTGKASQLAPGRQAGEGRGVDAEKLASRLRFNPEFANKVAGEIAPGTTVILTDAPVVRKPVVDSTYFASS